MSDCTLPPTLGLGATTAPDIDRLPTASLYQGTPWTEVQELAGMLGRELPHRARAWADDTAQVIRLVLEMRPSAVKRLKAQINASKVEGHDVSIQETGSAA